MKKHEKYSGMSNDDLVETCVKLEKEIQTLREDGQAYIQSLQKSYDQLEDELEGLCKKEKL